MDPTNDMKALLETIIINAKHALSACSEKETFSSPCPWDCPMACDASFSKCCAFGTNLDNMALQLMLHHAFIKYPESAYPNYNTTLKGGDDSDET